LVEVLVRLTLRLASAEDTPKGRAFALRFGAKTLVRAQSSPASFPPPSFHKANLEQAVRTLQYLIDSIMTH
jgi:hypothetical protein